MDGCNDTRSGSKPAGRSAPCGTEDRDELVDRVRWQVADGSYEPERKLLDVIDALAADLHLKPRRSTPSPCHDHPVPPDDRATASPVFYSPCFSS